MTTPLRLALTGAMTLLMAGDFALTGHPWLALVAGGLGLAWLALEAPLKPAPSGQPEEPRQPYAGGWAAALGLVAFCGLAAFSIFLLLPGWLALLVVALALAAWDLARLDRRLQEAPDEATIRRIERRHLARLGLALGIGLILGAISLVLTIQLTFAAGLALGFFALVALTLAAREIRKN